jgi:hypothetical protein
MGTRPDFPGRPGSPGRRDGHFPVEEIRVWMAGIRSAVEDVDDAELAAVNKRVRLLELEEKEAAASLRLQKLADVDEVGQFCEQKINNTKAVLEAMKDKVIAELPAGIGVKVRQSIYRTIQQMLDIAFDELAGMEMGDDDETEVPDE